jgi:hypothetical protein
MKLDPRLNGASPDQKAQAMYQAEAKALFVKYKVQSICELYAYTHIYTHTHSQTYHHHHWHRHIR